MTLLGLDFTTAATSTDEEAIEGNFRGPLEELAQWLANPRVYTRRGRQSGQPPTK